MKEHYTTYEQAVKLKELGFDERTTYEYTEIVKDSGREEWDEDEQRMMFIEDINYYPKLRLDQAQAWLREVKGIHISLNPYSISPDRYDGDNYFWSFELFHVPTGGWLKVNGGGFDTYQLALSAGIDKALELLTNRQRYDKE